jgi:hypothetical protein
VSTRGACSLEEVDCLDERECLAACAGVRALRDLWEPVATSSFFRLGVASYAADEGTGRERYAESVRRLRPALLDRFGWLYERIAVRLADALGGPVTFPEWLSPPGFHIWLADVDGRAFVPITHVDLQFMRHDWWQEGTPRLDDPRSFTVPLALPEQGGGLNVWPLDMERSLHCERNEIERWLSEHSPTFHMYRRGALVLHNGLQFHQIAPIQNARPDDERITLQGHALRCDDRWCAYW